MRTRTLNSLSGLILASAAIWLVAGNPASALSTSNLPTGQGVLSAPTDGLTPGSPAGATSLGSDISKFKQLVTDAKSAAGDGEQATGDSKQATGDAKQLGSDAKHPIANAKQLAGDAKQVGSDGKQVVDDGKQLTGDAKQVTQDAKDIPAAAKGLLKDLKIPL